MILYDTPGTRLWLTRRKQISQILELSEGSDLFLSLIRDGVQESDIARFIKSGHKIKSPQSSSADTQQHLSNLLERGGLIAGGCALRAYTFRSGSGDVDIFFGSFLSFARAVIESTSFPQIDICLYDKNPWEGFDLTAPMISYGKKTGFSVSEECAATLDSGICEIRPDWIFHPAATMRRIAKYGSYGFRFKSSQIAALAAFYGVRDDLTQAALTYAV